jgi:hypothetical protein
MNNKILLLRTDVGEVSFGEKTEYKSEVVEETNMEDNKSTNVKKTVKSGITFGSALAMVISYTTWKSVGWAIFHGLLSWVYVIYFLLRY